MKKVAVITSRFPIPLDKGDKLRIFHHIVELSKRAEVHLICFYDREPELVHWKEMQVICKKVYTFELQKKRSQKNAIVNFLKGYPLQLGYFYNEHLKKRIHWLLDSIRPDHIHCHLVRMAPYVMNYNSCPKSLDYMDSLVLNDMAGQHLNFFPAMLLISLERRRIRDYEKKVFEYFNSHFIISERDRNHLSGEFAKEVTILPNGTSHLCSNESKEKVFDICFCGNLGYAPNVKAVQYLVYRILPLIDDVRCVIAGANVASSILQLERENLIIMSPVPQMSSIYLQSKLQVAPIFNGSGQQNKILEAMVSGIPNITSSFVNQSIGARATEEIIICDSAGDFARHIKELLSHPIRRKEISQKANKFVKRNFNWSVNTAPLIEAIIDD